jgi:hypothetical protein
MDFSIVSFNVRGLTLSRAQTRLQQYLSSLFFNILFIQKHKLRQSDWTFLGKRIWRGGQFFVAPAEDGLNALRNDNVTSGRGGLATAVATQFVPFITFDQISPCGRAIVLHLDGLPCGPLGLLNVHGPNETADRADLWDSLAQMLDPSRPWLVGGDFNMVTASINQQGGSPADLVRSEASAWSHLSSTLGLVEYLPLPNQAIQFTWDNHRQDDPSSITPGRILKRLDRFYCCALLLELCPRAHTEILATQVLSF